MNTKKYRWAAAALIAVMFTVLMPSSFDGFCVYADYGPGMADVYKDSLPGIIDDSPNGDFGPKEDNWWELDGTVDTPCGPDNEWFYPRVDGKDSSDFTTGDRYVEIGNDVYMQYKKTATGYEPLANKNVDTGFGLDRLLLFLNGLDDGYKTDLFDGAIKYLEQSSGKSYDNDKNGVTEAINIV